MDTLEVHRFDGTYGRGWRDVFHSTPYVGKERVALLGGAFEKVTPYVLFEF